MSKIIFFTNDQFDKLIDDLRETQNKFIALISTRYSLLPR